MMMGYWRLHHAYKARTRRTRQAQWARRGRWGKAAVEEGYGEAGLAQGSEAELRAGKREIKDWQLGRGRATNTLRFLLERVKHQRARIGI